MDLLDHSSSLLIRALTTIPIPPHVSPHQSRGPSFAEKCRCLNTTMPATLLGLLTMVAMVATVATVAMVAMAAMAAMAMAVATATTEQQGNHLAKCYCLSVCARELLNFLNQTLPTFPLHISNPFLSSHIISFIALHDHFSVQIHFVHINSSICSIKISISIQSDSV